MRKTVIASLIAVPLLAACSPKPAPVTTPAAKPAVSPPAIAAAPQPPEVSSNTLMHAVFGEGWYAEDRQAVVTLPIPDKRDEEMPYVVTAAGQTTLSTGETVLATNSAPADENGHAFGTRANSGVLGIYLLRKVDGNWQVIKRLDSVASLGSDEKIGIVKWLDLGKDRPGLAVLHGTETQGFVEYLALFDLRAEHIHDLTDGAIRTQSGNTASCNPDGKVECFETYSTWTLQPSKSGAALNDLVFSFKEFETPAGSARYAFDGKRYRLVSGANPVRGI